jgi:fused signal recognition particle receptor
MALFSKLKSSLSKTRTGVLGKLQQVIMMRPKIDDELLDELEELLITSDIGVDTSLTVIENLRQRVSREHLSDPAKLQGLLHEELKKLLNGEQEEIVSDFFSVDKKPYIIMVVGVNGTGKTTTIGKLASQFTSRGKKVLVAAADTFRAAASEQLEIWAQRSESQIVQQQSGADPAAVAFDALNAAMSRDIDVLIIDTAGRLHTQVNLMEELKKVKRVVTKKLADAPHEVLLVLDATVGQNAKRQVEEFGRAVELSGIVLTKLDGTAKGGVVISIANEYKIPVKFIGVGEQIEDLEQFKAETFVDAIFQT